MRTFLVQVSFQNYRVGQIVMVTDGQDSWAWDNLASAGYLKELPAHPDAQQVLASVTEFLDDPSIGVQLKPRRRKRKEADSGEDPAEPDPSSPDSPE